MQRIVFILNRNRNGTQEYEENKETKKLKVRKIIQNECNSISMLMWDDDKNMCVAHAAKKKKTNTFFLELNLNPGNNDRMTFYTGKHFRMFYALRFETKSKQTNLPVTKIFIYFFLFYSNLCLWCCRE